MFASGCSDSDTDKIDQLIRDFADAVDRGDQAQLASVLCSDLAAKFVDSDGVDPEDRGVVKEKEPEVTISDITVTGTTATARVARPPQPAERLSFRQEGGVWKVCS